MTENKPGNSPSAELDRSRESTFHLENASEGTVLGESIDGPVVDLREGDRLGKYEIRRLLGKGAMGAVYLGFDPVIEREVAIKVLPRTVAAHPQALGRFLTEARSTGQLSHPNVVSLFDIAEQDGQHYIVMEVLDGGSLGEKVEAGEGLPWKDACEMVAQAADGLAAAHARGLVHRDIKPDNLMSTSDGVVKVVDFGLSKLIDAGNDSRDGMTKAGAILGTPQYMSPEQCESADVDARSDIYSLGGTLFRLLTGRLPYEEFASIVQVIMAHAAKPIPDPLLHVPDLPAACKSIVDRAMAKDPADRYATATEMAQDLRALVYGSPGAVPADEERKPLEYRVLESVVIVEPSKMQAMIGRDAFQRAGVASVNVCNTAETAREAFRLARADVVISAMQLKDGRGLDLFSELRSSEAQTGAESMLHVLNTSDFTLTDLIDLGQTSPFAVVSKKTKPDEILRVISACTWLNFAQGPLATDFDPTGSRFLFICDSEKIPEAIAEQVRRMSLLDVQVTTFDDLAGGFVPDGQIDLTCAMRTAGDAAGDTSLYSSMLARVKVDSHAVAALQVDGDAVTLRAVRCGGFSAVANCAFDDTRMRRLAQIACS